MPDSHKVIAVVDDDPEMRAAMASLLSAYGYGAETFDSAETFLTCASTSKATCLVVDIQLGDISGVELAHQLAADGFTYPIIFMISERLDRVADGRRVVQAAACIGRPFTADFLAALLQENAQNIVEPLEALIDAEILRSNHEDREARFEFRHALLQRAAYESMVQSERRATHGPARFSQRGHCLQ